MCLGIPMRVIEMGDGWAVCEGRGEQRHVSTLLLENHDLNDWVLVHLDSAMRILGETEAQQIGDAIEALDAALKGHNFDHLFADLVGREPELPRALQNAAQSVSRAPSLTEKV